MPSLSISALALALGSQLSAHPSDLNLSALQGNQAYKNGDLSMAENYYKQGLSCISKEEASRSCLRALLLCYSNLAATHMSLGRMRDALEDCMMDAEIDPNFFRVQLRAANCYLALGEVGGAS